MFTLRFLFLPAENHRIHFPIGRIFLYYHLPRIGFSNIHISWLHARHDLAATVNFYYFY